MSKIRKLFSASPGADYYLLQIKTCPKYNANKIRILKGSDNMMIKHILIKIIFKDLIHNYGKSLPIFLWKQEHHHSPDLQ